MINNIKRKVKIIGYEQLAEPRKVSFISFYGCEKCNDFPNCMNPANCTFVKYISERMVKENVSYTHLNNTPILRLVLPTEQDQTHAQQVIARAQKLRTNRALISHVKAK